ncbi:protein adenylyltransferase SelO, mitochondrial [Tamandua tetradactyla]|uniref:protein adenylyltransferase SelO, mitochondrial n=1 Tax=Tamandua tetradactyla TaxID=48850 RepID=UPI004054475A
MAALGGSLAVARSGSLPLARCPSSALRCAWAGVMEPAPRWLAGLRFDNRALRVLPVEAVEPESSPPAPRSVPGACFSRVRPAPLRQPRLVALSEPALTLLGLGAPPADAADREAREAEAALFFSGNALLPGTEPAAHCYCGHQFGQFAGQLGDGAAMYLGEVCTAAGARWELQLKGAGPTPYSRQADGRKVLRSSIREFLCSEAMFHLGIPTTRAAACVTSASTVVRDMFYDGNPKHEQCTVVLRVAPTFLRFGSFEIFKPTDEHTGRAGPSVGRDDIRVQMLDYVISTFYPEIQAAHALSERPQRNAAFLQEVARRTARMVAEWQCVGFCHGVLNTDNMSILGLTIDYGPFGFLDRYDPDHVCNASDGAGRYAFGKQPEVCRWNLQKLAEALEPELPQAVAEAALAEFDAEFQRYYLNKMRRKLGLVRAPQEEDRALVARLLETMHLTGADFTNSFALLSSFPEEPASPALEDFLDRLLAQCASLEELKLASQPRVDPEQLALMLMLAQSHPQLWTLIGSQPDVTRELARREQRSRLEQLSPATLRSQNQGHWAAWLQEYRARLEKDAESAEDVPGWRAERLQVMLANNPKYVLRNYIAQKAIEAAENGDFSEVQRVLMLLEAPYHREGEATEPDSKPPAWAAGLSVT